MLYVPLVPLNRTGEYVECRACRSALPVSAIQDSLARSGSSPAGGGVMAYPMSAWGEHERAAILDELQERALRIEVDGDDLLVPADHEGLVDRVITELTGVAPGPADDGTEVTYGMDEWTDQERSTILDDLQERRLSFRVEGDDLVVRSIDEDLVDQIILSSADSKYSYAESSEFGYSTADWTVSQRQEISQRCREIGIEPRFEDGELVVAGRHEAAVDQIIEAVTGDRNRRNS